MSTKQSKLISIIDTDDEWVGVYNESK